VVERRHVLRAAEIIFGAQAADTSLDDLVRSGTGECVFVSHASKDKPLAHELARRLTKTKVSCFVAKKTIPDGAEWADHIRNAIRKCRVFVLLNSATVQKSDWCKYEIGAALVLRKPIVAVGLDGTRLPKVLEHLQANFSYRTENQKRKLIDHLKTTCLLDKEGTA
jgi:hypothetical protein